MASAVLAEPSVIGNFPFGGAGSDVNRMKRKTPSELRGEQLKRKSGEFAQKYLDTRVTEVYPVKKSSDRCKVFNEKEKTKDPLPDSQVIHGTINPSAACGFNAKMTSSVSCDGADKLHNIESSNPFARNIDQGSLKNEKYNQHNVAELHLGKKLPDSAKIDMEKALKELIPRHIPTSSTPSADSSGKLADLPSFSGNLYSEFSIAGHRTPLDLTLKTTLRLVSSSSVKWCHRLSANLATLDLNQFTSLLSCNKDQNADSQSGLSTTTEVLFSKALHSWIYPQTSLPSSIISAMTLSSSKAEMDFFQRRQKDWEISFQNIYYLLRKNLCCIFYVYTAQFIVLFTGGNFLGKNKWSCNAYLSRSTRGLRSLLKKHDIGFSMPLCHAEVGQATDDDLVELSEIDKQKLGQTFHLDSSSGVDNTPESLLAFIGNENVHSLYDFLLNYRFFLNSLACVDVPTLYAPVAFQNASLCFPEARMYLFTAANSFMVRCKEMKRADSVAPTTSVPGSGAEGYDGSGALSSSGMCFSIEVNESLLPPWVVSGICASMGSGGKTFEASFTTDPASIGLNIGLDSSVQKSDIAVDLNKSSECSEAFGIPVAVVDRRLRSGSPRQLKYMHGSYVAQVAPN